jgi:hypothetical protein
VKSEMRQSQQNCRLNWSSLMVSEQKPIIDKNQFHQELINHEVLGFALFKPKNVKAVTMKQEDVKVRSVIECKSHVSESNDSYISAS